MAGFTRSIAAALGLTILTVIFCIVALSSKKWLTSNNGLLTSKVNGATFTVAFTDLEIGPFKLCVFGSCDTVSSSCSDNDNSDTFSDFCNGLKATGAFGILAILSMGVASLFCLIFLMRPDNIQTKIIRISGLFLSIAAFCVFLAIVIFAGSVRNSTLLEEAHSDVSSGYILMILSLFTTIGAMIMAYSAARASSSPSVVTISGSDVGYAPMNDAPNQGAGYYPPANGGYMPQQGGYAPQQGGYVPQQGGYVPQQGGYTPAVYSPPGGVYSPPYSPPAGPSAPAGEKFAGDPPSY